MKVQELRIGNIVEYLIRDEMDAKKEWWEPSQIDAQDILWLSQNPDDDDYRPIPLTEERLVRLGATVYEFDNGQTNQYRIGERLFVIRDGIVTDYGTSTKLPYVHSLQNFIFALTGEELTTKTPIQ